MAGAAGAAGWQALGGDPAVAAEVAAALALLSPIRLRPGDTLQIAGIGGGPGTGLQLYLRSTAADRGPGQRATVVCEVRSWYFLPQASPRPERGQGDWTIEGPEWV